VASVLPFVIRHDFLLDFLTDKGAVFYDDRYYFLGMAMLFLYIFVYIDCLLVKNYLLCVKKTAVILGLIIIISLNLPTFRMAPFVGMEWSKYSELLVSTQQSLEINEVRILKIPINPPGCFIELAVKK